MVPVRLDLVKQTEKKSEDKTEEPVPVPLLKNIEAKIDKRVPYGLVREIARLKDEERIEKKIEEINAGFRKLEPKYKNSYPDFLLYWRTIEHDYKEDKSPQDFYYIVVKHTDKVFELYNQIEPAHAQYLNHAFTREKILQFFDKDPDRAIKIFKQIDSYNAKTDNCALGSLTNPHVRDLFVKYPEEFVQMAKMGKSDTADLFYSLDNDIIAQRFDKDPQSIIGLFKKVWVSFKDELHPYSHPLFRLLGEYWENRALSERFGTMFVDETDKLLKACRQINDYFTIPNRSEFFHFSITHEAIFQKFVEYVDGRMTVEQFFTAMVSFSNARVPSPNYLAIELGEPLDELHDAPAERKKYLDVLKTAHVVALLSSNPELFYTSTNHMLFDRLKADFKGKGLDYLVSRYGLDDKNIENFTFRAINYDRLVGKDNSIFNEADAKKAIEIIYRGIFVDTFDSAYFYLLANGIEKLGKQTPLVKEVINERLGKLKSAKRTEDQNRIYNALQYLQFVMEPALAKGLDRETLEAVGKKGMYDLADYRDENGKAQALQIFDKKDTEKDHWPLTKQAFAKAYGKPKTGSEGELIYENKTERVILFMGDDADANKEFAISWRKENKNGLLTFRGHSFSLERNLPPEVFGNADGRYALIPGSCGSAGSVAAYISKNPKTDLRFFSNTSTGRGQVTNELLFILLEQQKPVEFQKMLQNNAKRIERAGGDAGTIRVWNAGEQMLEYVKLKTSSRQ